MTSRCGGEGQPWISVTEGAGERKGAVTSIESREGRRTMDPSVWVGSKGHRGSKGGGGGRRLASRRRWGGEGSGWREHEPPVGEDASGSGRWSLEEIE
jgi:hypothetical protein